ncbi:hypothetical protein KP509_04G075500 [Ceratopteris richardii]|uniref:GTP cyclohydrolase II domain-containing protein n=1 Tax=Ceratopteris richardii TaxID=49495 RepID=A0A8T2V1E1_CERRI|nr:hypothetical protein KP509_04G075500 [Ceratopteris richardii]
MGSAGVSNTATAWSAPRLINTRVNFCNNPSVLKQCWSYIHRSKFLVSIAASTRKFHLVSNSHKANEFSSFFDTTSRPTTRPCDSTPGININGSASAEIMLKDKFEPFPQQLYEDPDCPTEGFTSIDEAVQALKEGKFVVVVDDEDRENEGDLIIAASKVNPSAMNFLVRHTTGIICVAMKGDDLDRLNIPLMVQDKENEEALHTAFTISVDAKNGVTTGVSASDKTATILALASKDSQPEDFRRPGHIFPLRYREGGVLKRSGHTEASVDLSIMAGLPPVGVLCEIVNDRDGSMARLPQLQEFAAKYQLPIVSIADIVRYKRKRETLILRTATARLPTKWGSFTAFSYKSKLDGIEHIALVKGKIGDGYDILVRVHSECLTGDILGSTRCDCGLQLEESLRKIEKARRGVVVYLRGHEGRGIGLGHKLQAYNLQDKGRDTVEANLDLGLPVDSREYGIGAQILRDVGVKTMKLMTNNPAKYIGLKGYGLEVIQRIPLVTPITKENQRYLETKRTKMGHIYG